jgi:hypothetical protein
MADGIDQLARRVGLLEGVAARDDGRSDIIAGGIGNMFSFERIRSMLCLASVTASAFRGVKLCRVDFGKMGRSGRMG